MMGLSSGVAITGRSTIGNRSLARYARIRPRHWRTNGLLWIEKRNLTRSLHIDNKGRPESGLEVVVHRSLYVYIPIPTPVFRARKTGLHMSAKGDRVRKSERGYASLFRPDTVVSDSQG